MLTALQLLFSPFQGWEKITTAQRGFLWIFCFYLLPLLAMALSVESYLLVQLGEKRGELGFVIQVSAERAVRYGVAYFVFLLAGILVAAQFLSLVSQSFNVQDQLFSVVCGDGVRI